MNSPRESCLSEICFLRKFYIVSRGRFQMFDLYQRLSKALRELTIKVLFCCPEEINVRGYIMIYIIKVKCRRIIDENAYNQTVR